jgi:hypothetical protein
MKHDAASLLSKLEEEKRAREAVTQKWLQLWGLYKVRPIQTYEDDEWKSKLNDGRIFEIVETIGSYIRNALFFSDKWVNLESNEPELAEVTPLVATYFLDCLNHSNFKREFRVFLTQLLLTGFSCMIPYWDTETDKISFSALNSYDMYVESTKRPDADSYSFRVSQLNYDSFCDWVDSGLLDISEYSDEDDAWEHWKAEDETRTSDMYFLRDTIPLVNREYVEVIEYWCPKEKKILRIINEDINTEESFDECPWLIGCLFETPDDAYSLSVVESAIGLVLANNILHNRRLDNMAISIDNMWLMVDDGVINPEEIKAAPGKVIMAASPNSLLPLSPPTNSFNVTYQEQAVLDNKIDRNIGTGAMISANSYRQAERVTASEIEATKDAGGNRLNDIFEHIENTFIIPCLYRAFKLLKENMPRRAVVKQPSDYGNVSDYFELFPEDIKRDYKVKVTATQSVINRDRKVSMLTEFLTLAANIPQWQQMINYENLFVDLLNHFGFDDPNRYILKQQEEAPTAPTTPAAAMAAEAEAIGGKPMADALANKAALGQLPGLAAEMAGYAPQDIEELPSDATNATGSFLSTPSL